ncbi:uncharacterized protein EV420DRAFT_1476790 [Desarmillaria tabescens]|uniref:Protein kinase domain-containing protein n=1 Tax=Armillaria tabescens TaxID=1929756 RepID=A0AA39NCE8_ARMTA|nr:uncharacterized protein EV420DRAFT_1476790 [Desarmillaria tabescens]KAK0463029.1 hypothetical protein EV420DRAFT_1476790 [Desarmillaria tabescens]
MIRKYRYTLGIRLGRIIESDLELFSNIFVQSSFVILGYHESSPQGIPSVMAPARRKISRDNKENIAVELDLCSLSIDISADILPEENYPCSPLIDPFCHLHTLFRDSEVRSNRCGHPKDGKGLKLKLYDDKMVEIISLGQTISCARGIVSRNTCVIEATSEREGWKGKELIVKISWPAINRESEAHLVQKARDKARMMTHGKKPNWALDHLPDILLSQDFDYDADSTQMKLMAFFEKALLVEERKVEYEKRVCRVTVQERLYPLEDLKTVKEHAQVFFDILQIHKWVYDHPRIIHRDISPGNIMWRHNAKGDLCGVLNDFDLSTRLHATGPSSVQRTGTLPYMAYELLISDENGNPPQHLYRHDIESIFYVILLRCCRYDFVTTLEHVIPQRIKVPSRFDEWCTTDREPLNDKKGNFWFRDSRPIVNKGFTDFEPWLRDLYRQFMLGFAFKRLEEGGKEPFDDQTLQGQVSYPTIVNICRQFGGSNLEIHNDQLQEES